MVYTGTRLICSEIASIRRKEVKLQSRCLFTGLGFIEQPSWAPATLSADPATCPLYIDTWHL
jgi:hypothetical protein